MLRPRITDHRGRRRVLCDTRYGHLTRPRTRSLSGLAGWHVRQATFANRFMPWYFVGLVVLMAGDLAFRRWMGVTLYPPIWAFGPAVVPFGFFIFQNVSTHPKVVEGRARVVRSLTRAGICPGCGYSLAELEPETDGCRVCPECGGAWRRSSAEDAEDGAVPSGSAAAVPPTDRAGP